LILDETTADLLGYFSLTFKEITYPQDAVSKTANKRVGAVVDTESNLVRVRGYLIGQLGKNKVIDANPLNLEIILTEIYGVINQARELVGGRTIILECVQDEKLIGLYESHGFTRIKMEPNHNGYITMYIIVKD
jgi:hypothetical protein